MTGEDPREVIKVLDDIEPMARFLVHLDYPAAEVKAVLSQQFPSGDVDGAYERAVEHLEECKAQLAEQLNAEGVRAVEAEHDISKTMHKEGSDG